MSPRGLEDLRPIFDADPATYYDAVRALTGERGIAWDATLGGWLVTSYRLCETGLHATDLGRQRLALPPGQHPDLVACAEDILGRQMMFQEDARGRREHWRERIGAPLRHDAEIVDDVLDALSPASPIADLYGSVLQRYTSMVAASAVGLQEPLRVELYPLIWRVVAFLDGKLRSDAEFYESMYAIVALYDRLGAAARDTESAETLPDLLLTLVAGHESIAFLLATLFANVPARIPAREIGRALVEALRFDCPVQLVGRRARADVVMGGERIAAAARVYFHVGAANRDPAVFERPDVFERTRSGPPPLAFGGGAGECIGRSAAMRAAMTFVGGLDRRGWWFENLVGERRSGIGGRGYKSLRARVGVAPGPQAEAAP